MKAYPQLLAVLTAAFSTTAALAEDAPVALSKTISPDGKTAVIVQAPAIGVASATATLASDAPLALNKTISPNGSVTVTTLAPTIETEDHGTITITGSESPAGVLQILAGPDGNPPIPFDTVGRLPMGPQPFVGIVTAEVPAAVSAQLGLPAGFGLLVQEVLPDSPAAKAGIQQYDILKTFNDQQLVNPDQLSTLVRAAGKDKEVGFTVIRKGQEQHLSVTVGERLMSPPPVGNKFWKAIPFPVPNPPKGGGPAGDNDSADEQANIDAKVKKITGAARLEADRVHREAEEVQARIRKELDRAGIPSSEILREAGSVGGAQLKAIRKDAVTTVDSSKAKIFLKDADGSIEVSVDDGHRTLVAKDASGKEVFSGPIDTEEQRKSVPEQFQKKLEQIKAHVQTHESFAPIKPHIPDPASQSGSEQRVQ